MKSRIGIIVVISCVLLPLACKESSSKYKNALLLFLPGSTPTAPATDFTVTVTSRYLIDGVMAKPLTLVRGTTYTFHINTPGHPFYISTDSVGDNSGIGEVTDGVVGSQTQNGTLTFTPNSNHPNLLYYQCAIHPNFGSTINITN